MKSDPNVPIWVPGNHLLGLGRRAGGTLQGCLVSATSSVRSSRACVLSTFSVVLTSWAWIITSYANLNRSLNLCGLQFFCISKLGSTKWFLPCRVDELNEWHVKKATRAVGLEEASVVPLESNFVPVNALERMHLESHDFPWGTEPCVSQTSQLP